MRAAARATACVPGMERRRQRVMFTAPRLLRGGNTRAQSASWMSPLCSSISAESVINYQLNTVRGGS
jgi:hypothetical protein